MNKEHKIFLSVCGSILAVVAIAIFLSFGSGDSYAVSSDYNCSGLGSHNTLVSNGSGGYVCCPAAMPKYGSSYNGTSLGGTKCYNNFNGTDDGTCAGAGGTHVTIDSNTYACVTDAKTANYQPSACYYCGGGSQGGGTYQWGYYNSQYCVLQSSYTSKLSCLAKNNETGCYYCGGNSQGGGTYQWGQFATTAQGGSCTFTSSYTTKASCEAANGGSGSGGSSVTPACTPSTTYYVTSTSGLSCRSGPGDSYSIDSSKGKAHCSTVKACKHNDSYWYTSDGCYVTAGYLEKDKPDSCESTPTPTPVTYTISYNMNGGTKGTNAPTSGTVGSDVQISNPTKTFTVTGNANGTGATVGNATSKTQTFAGWTATNLGSGAKIGSSSSPSTSWDGTTATKLTYFKDLRSSSGTVTMTANWTPVKLNLPTISKSGYTCKWNTKADGTGTALASGSEYTPSATTSSATLYAVCQKATATKFSVTFDANGGEDAPKSQEKTIDVDLTLTSDFPTREGYTFVGWNTEKNGSGATYLPGSKYKNNENVTLYAQWDEGETILVTYIFGDGEFSAESFDKGETITIDTDIPTKDGYTFGEWNTKKDGSGKTYKPGDKYTGDKDLTLYAIWGKNKDKTDDEPVQVQTGNALILVALVTGLAALCYIFLYTKRMKTNN